LISTRRLGTAAFLDTLSFFAALEIPMFRHSVMAVALGLFCLAGVNEVSSEPTKVAGRKGSVSKSTGGAGVPGKANPVNKLPTAKSKRTDGAGVPGKASPVNKLPTAKSKSSGSPGKSIPSTNLPTANSKTKDGGGVPAIDVTANALPAATSRKGAVGPCD